MPYSDDIILTVHAQNQLRNALKAATRSVNRFRRLHRLSQLGVPAGQWGSRFLYCTHPVEIKVPKLDKNLRRTGRFTTSTGPCSRRFRNPKAYRRHWHSQHEGA